MKELVDQIERLAAAHPELRSDLHFGPAGEHDVNDLEKELQTTLPRSFRAYLLGFAGGLMLGYEFAGIPTQKSLIPPAPAYLGLPNMDEFSIESVAHANARLRKYYPPGYVFVCSDGGDYKFFLDTSKMSCVGECPVVMLGPGTPLDGMPVAESFIQFLQRLATHPSFGNKLDCG